jgi:hypothetical protein
MLPLHGLSDGSSKCCISKSINLIKCSLLPFLLIVHCTSSTVVALEIRHHPPVLPIFSFDTPRGKNIDEFDSWVWIIAQKLLCHIPLNPARN